MITIFLNIIPFSWEEGVLQKLDVLLITAAVTLPFGRETATLITCSICYWPAQSLLSYSSLCWYTVQSHSHILYPFTCPKHPAEHHLKGWRAYNRMLFANGVFSECSAWTLYNVQYDENIESCAEPSSQAKQMTQQLCLQLVGIVVQKREAWNISDDDSNSLISLPQLGNQRWCVSLKYLLKTCSSFYSTLSKYT